MKRGEIWTIAGGPGFAGKPRPALIVQDDAYQNTETVTVCPITSIEVQTFMLRQTLKPDAGNGLRQSSHVMIDKMTTLPRGRLGRRIGTLANQDMARIDQVLLAFLGLSG